MAPGTQSAVASKVASTTCIFRLVMMPREWPNMAAVVGAEQPSALAVVAKLFCKEYPGWK